MQSPKPWARKIVSIEDGEGNPIECIAELDVRNAPTREFPWRLTPRYSFQENPQEWRAHGDWIFIRDAPEQDA